MALVSYWDTNIPTASEVRNKWCFGLPLTIGEDGTQMPDESIELFILDAVRLVERKLGIYLKPTTIVCNPEERGIAADQYDVSEPPYDYDVKAWMNYGFLQLRERPVQSVTGLTLALPNGLVIMDFMRRPEWIKLYPTNGQIQLVPYAGDPTIFSLMGGSQAGYPFVTGTINTNLPQMIYVDYVAGYPVGKIPMDVRSIVARIAAVTVLGIAGEALLAGIASLSTSIDGLSESFSTTASAENTTYGAHVYQYQKEIKEFFDPREGAARSSERGITMTGL